MLLLFKDLVIKYDQITKKNDYPGDKLHKLSWKVNDESKVKIGCVPACVLITRHTLKHKCTK